MSVQINSNTPRAQTQAAVTSVSVAKSNESDTSSSETQLPSNGRELRLAEIRGSQISIGEEQLIKAIDKAVKVLSGPSTSVEMQVHKKTSDVVMKVINKETGDVIREIPPEKMLDLVAKMMEIAGILIDERV